MARQRLTRIPTPHVSPRGAPWLVMGPCIVEIDRIVIRKVQYQLEVNRCRNEEIIVKDNLGGCGLLWAGRPRAGFFRSILGIRHTGILGISRRKKPAGLVKGPYIVEIDRIVIRDVQYQFEVNRCINEEIIVKGNFE
ncbi:hypothetical protein DPMN_012878 [Dreissena polymorpha]|uniref:Uncharacterized protein n=1 Tax=Dreissena polymorpha TaxID=45954 RepID=A0A9D4N8V4_DREPO|nr:hypothetical protein DPMN_012878 [Dreissena polymorpha]